VDSRTAVIVPFDNRVVFVCLLNCAEFPCRLSEVAQTLDAISGIELLVSGGGVASEGFLARSESGGDPGYARGGWGVLLSFGMGRFLSSVISSIPFKRSRQRASRRPLLIQAYPLRDDLDLRMQQLFAAPPDSW
jgi:hypothetical protein